MGWDVGIHSSSGGATASADAPALRRLHYSGVPTATPAEDSGDALRSIALPLSGKFETAEPLSGMPAFVRSASSPKSIAALVRGKRILDPIVAGMLLLVLLPVFAIVAFLIVCEDRGPVIFKQSRVGKDGKTFSFFKFRSMVVNAEALKDQLMDRNEASGPIFKMRHDPRITRIGRWLRRYSIDELPQLINVVRGDMSLVGPRPHLPREVVHYRGDQHERLTVRPGLLCLREVLGRSNVGFDRWVEMDLWYIRHASLRLDIWILARAIRAILIADGAH